jgi:hypothetical protein
MKATHPHASLRPDTARHARAHHAHTPTLAHTHTRIHTRTRTRPYTHTPRRRWAGFQTSSGASLAACSAPPRPRSSWRPSGRSRRRAMQMSWTVDVQWKGAGRPQRAAAGELCYQPDVVLWLSIVGSGRGSGTQGHPTRFLPSCSAASAAHLRLPSTLLICK